MISLLCPTRGRPRSMRRFVASATNTATGEIEVVFAVDPDDTDSRQEADRLAEEFPVTVVRPDRRLVLSEYWNKCAEAARGVILGHMGDDIVFRTHGWDEKVKQAFAEFPDRIVFVHGSDGIQDDRLGTHGFVSRRWVDTLGYMVPPYFSSDWNDTWLTEVADMIGRRVYLPDLVTEHLHPAAGKAELDLTHRERIARGEHDRVVELYDRLLPEREADARKLSEVIGCPAK